MWPSRNTRIVLAVVGAVCLVALFCMSALIDGGHGAIPRGTRVLVSFGDLVIASPSVQANHRTSGLWYLVALGDPRIFSVTILVLGGIALFYRDRRLAFLCVFAPLITEIIAQCIAKPSFFKLNGGVYGYPSGHTVAVTALAAATFFFIRRILGPRSALLLGPLLIGLTISAAVGVVVLHMHPARDALGGLAMGIGMMSLSAAIILKPSPAITDT